jgi:hypothetical protein
MGSDTIYSPPKATEQIQRLEKETFERNFQSTPEFFEFSRWALQSRAARSSFPIKPERDSRVEPHTWPFLAQSKEAQN